MVLLALICVIRRARRNSGDGNEKPTGARLGWAGNLRGWRRKQRETHSESRIWGGATSYGVRMTLRVLIFRSGRRKAR